MALGDTYNNNKNDRKVSIDPTIYSPYKFSNIEGVDPSSLSITFWGSTMKVSINPKKDMPNGEVAFDYENNISAYLTHTKARMLAEEIKAFMGGKINSAGVDTNKAFINISNGKEFGVNDTFLVIRSFDHENNTVASSYAYQFKKSNYAIRNFDEKKNDFEKIFYENLEIDQFVTLLEEYYTAMTGAIAFSVIDQSKYNNSRIQNKLDSIASKLGVEFTNTKSSTSGGGSFFNRDNNSDKPSTGFKTGSIEDMELN